jgi:hypothetical protein
MGKKCSMQTDAKLCSLIDDLVEYAIENELAEESSLGCCGNLTRTMLANWDRFGKCNYPLGRGSVFGKPSGFGKPTPR